jgi:hypothetical protein
MAREGTPMNVLRDPLGQASLATMGRYLRDVAPVQVIETMKRREWSLGYWVRRNVVPRISSAGCTCVSMALKWPIEAWASSS